MKKFIVHHNNVYGEETDNIIIAGETDEELQQQKKDLFKERGWKEDDCWSEEIKKDKEDNHV